MSATATPLDDARERLTDAFKFLGYGEGMYASAAVPRRETTVSIPLRRHSGEVEPFIGHRVQHSLRVVTARAHELPLPTAACLAVQRVAEANPIRGLYP